MSLDDHTIVAPVMLRWQLRLKHQLDYVNTYYEHLGKTPPIHPKNGVKVVHIQEWHGPKFWEIFEAKGHSSTCFEECQCSKNSCVDD